MTNEAPVELERAAQVGFGRSGASDMVGNREINGRK